MSDRHEASEFTRALNEAVLDELPFENTQDFEDAARGFIAPLKDGGRVANADGRVVYDPTGSIHRGRLRGAGTVNPSLWRQASAGAQGRPLQGRRPPVPGAKPGHLNLTIIEGDTGLILMDPLISAETARAALELYFEHVRASPSSRCCYSHSHVDHFGGVKGVVDEEDVIAGKVQIIAPVGFLEAAVAENVLAGNVMTRRALYQYGVLLPSDPKGQVGIGPGLAVSSGTVTLIPPTRDITYTGEKLEIDGLTFEFMLAPDTEAPAEMHWFVEELRALTAAENCCHTLHNTYTLRGRSDPRPAGMVAVPERDDRPLGPQDGRACTECITGRCGAGRPALRCCSKGRDAYRYINDPDPEARQPRPHARRDRRDRRAAPVALATLGSAPVLRDRQPHVKATYVKYLGPVRRQPGRTAQTPLRGLRRPLRRADGRRRRRS